MLGRVKASTEVVLVMTLIFRIELSYWKEQFYQYLHITVKHLRYLLLIKRGSLAQSFGNWKSKQYGSSSGNGPSSLHHILGREHGRFYIPSTCGLSSLYTEFSPGGSA